MVAILPQKSTLTVSFYLETLLPEVIKSVRPQRQTVGTSKTLLLQNNASAHKTKVTVTFVKEQSIQVFCPSPLQSRLGSV